MNNEIFRASFKNASKVITKLEEDMQKQRQEILDLIDKFAFRCNGYDLPFIQTIEFNKLKEQLNQPKEERKE